MARVYDRFFAKYPEPSALAGETRDGLREVIGCLGLHWRIPLMIEMAGRVAERGAPPDRQDALEELPGVGPYAAAAYLSLHRGSRATIIDANVVRWIGRVFGFMTDGESRRKRSLLDLADALTPRRAFRDYNYAVLDLAMRVCAARPACDSCPLARSLCHFAALRGPWARRIRQVRASSAPVG